MRKIIKNAIQCKLCGDIIESTDRHDYVECKCGACAVDGGHDYLRRSFKSKDCYLEHSEQRVLLDAMELNDCTPSHAQAIRLKNYSKEGLLIDEIIYDVMSEDKPNQQEQIKFKRDELKQYFPPTYTDEQIRKDVIKGLELLKRQRERNRDVR